MGAGRNDDDGTLGRGISSLDGSSCDGCAIKTPSRDWPEFEDSRRFDRRGCVCGGDEADDVGLVISQRLVRLDGGGLDCFERVSRLYLSLLLLSLKNYTGTGACHMEPDHIPRPTESPFRDNPWAEPS